MMKLMTLVTILLSTPFYFGTATTYNYSYYGEAIHSAPGMTFATYINAQTLGTTLASPEDLVIFEDTIYVIDSDTNQLTLIDPDFNLLTAETTFRMTPEFMASTTLSQEFGMVTRDANDLAWNMSVPSDYSVTTEPAVLVDDVVTFDMTFADNVFCDNCYLSQEGFAAEQGSYYRISFDAKSDLAKDISMFFGDYSVNPLQFTAFAPTETVTLGSDWTTYTYDFEMTEPSTEEEGELRFSLGDAVTTMVYFDNIRLESITGIGGDPIPYTNQVVDGTFDQNLLTLDSPQGLDVTDNGIFIADTGNYRIVKLNHDFEVVEIFSDMDDATFKIIDRNPVPEQDVETFLSDIVVDINQVVQPDVICIENFDPDNQRACRQLFETVNLNPDAITDTVITDMGGYWNLELIRDGETTDTLSLDVRYDDNDEIIAYLYNDAVYFEPEKITVDPTDRMYVVAKNVYEGILEINSDGAFNRFTGVNPIVLTPFEIFSRSLMTEEQLDQLQLFLPTEYTNVSIDDRNFIYATSRPSENNDENPIQLINPKGVDVIRKNGYFPPMGDVHYIVGMNNYVIDGPSTLVDIASTDYGIYTVLDQKRSRLFTYDSEGNLLYINGDEGSQSDKFSEGVAIGYFGDDLLILDRGTKTIVVYRLTEFGSYVNQAIAYHYEGEFEKAAEVWQDVIQINTNYEIAYNGIGKLLLRQGEYKEAMEYFKLGHDQYYYSKAFKEYRNQIIKDNFGFIMISVVVVAGGLLGLKIRSVYKKGGSILYED